MIRYPTPPLALIALISVLASAANAQDSTAVPSCPTTRDPATRLWCQGGEKWEAHDYSGAIPYLSKALELQRRRPTLSHTAWRVLVDNLGMAYGMKGDLKQAREIFEYGLATDSAYAMFYYLMADDYAEAGDERMAILYLQRAFIRQANVIAGESLPDPRTDDSFQRFMKDSAFVAALKNLPHD